MSVELLSMVEDQGQGGVTGMAGGTIKGQHRDRCGIRAVGILMAMCYLNLHR